MSVAFIVINSPSRSTVAVGSVVTDSFSTVRFALISWIMAIAVLGTTTARNVRFPKLPHRMRASAISAQIKLKKVKRLF